MEIWKAFENSAKQDVYMDFKSYLELLWQNEVVFLRCEFKESCEVFSSNTEFTKVVHWVIE